MRRRAEAELATDHERRSTSCAAQRNAAVRQLKDVEAELAQRTADLRHARHEIRMREAELEQAVVANGRGAAGDDAASQQAAAAPGTITPAELATVVAEAAAGAERLSASLAAADAVAVDGRTAPPATTAPGPARRDPRPARRRTPVRLRPGTTDDSAEAADHAAANAGCCPAGRRLQHLARRVVGPADRRAARTAGRARWPSCTLGPASRSRSSSTAPRSNGGASMSPRPAVQGALLARGRRGRRRHHRSCRSRSPPAGR